MEEEGDFDGDEVGLELVGDSVGVEEEGDFVGEEVGFELVGD